MGARAQKQMRTEGGVTFNGAPLTKRLKRRVGYVLQVGAASGGAVAELPVGRETPVDLPSCLAASLPACPPPKRCHPCHVASPPLCAKIPTHAHTCPPPRPPPRSTRQDDLLYESLTVKETLYYAAMLRLPRRMSHADKLRRVDLALTALGLRQCKDTIIGGRRVGEGGGGGARRANLEGLASIRAATVRRSPSWRLPSALKARRGSARCPLLPSRRRLLPQGHQRWRAQAHLHRRGAADRPLGAHAGKGGRGGGGGGEGRGGMQGREQGRRKGPAACHPVSA